MKRIYVAMIRALRAVLKPLGVLAWLERRGTRRALWLRSLFAIYDLEDLTHLDLPWWTFSATDAVAAFLVQGKKSAFEYGSGASTLWLAKRAASVCSVEHDAQWFAGVQAKTASYPNVDLRLVVPTAQGKIPSAKRGFEGQFFDDYVAAIAAAPGPFDLIVIDGRAREACLAIARNHLAPDGIIVLDDSRRARYRAAVAALNLPFLSLNGLAVCLPYKDETTLIAQTQITLDVLSAP